MIGSNGDLTAAFTLRQHEHGLSLFRADLTDPRAVLQAIVDARTNPPTPHVTPEHLLEQGYLLVQVPLSVFEERGFRCSDPDERGHFEVFAPAGCADPAAMFEQFAPIFACSGQVVLSALPSQQAGR